jgi:lactoylglutathione lyase
LAASPLPNANLFDFRHADSASKTRPVYLGVRIWQNRGFSPGPPDGSKTWHCCAFAVHLVLSSMYLYETHLSVKNTETSRAFYVELVGLRFAWRDPKRDIIFLWVGENRSTMLGLWWSDTLYGTQFHHSHLAFAVSLSELLSLGKRLNDLGVPTHNFARIETTEPSVIGWMPSAQLYFRDPDGHSLELIALLDDEPDPGFIGSLTDWQKRLGQPSAHRRP